ncbi:MAG: hypothetical protein JL56_06060 [Desulfotomaculum sp. BICA1-6]|nr:MAG: hypothetical protein JL56_06060 [Desulfotomaculum sp. BICA1-6]
MPISMDNIKKFAEVLTFLVIIFYVIGFIIHTIYLGILGIFNIDFIKVRYVYIGFIFSIIPCLSALCGYLMSITIDESKKKNNLSLTLLAILILVPVFTLLIFLAWYAIVQITHGGVGNPLHPGQVDVSIITMQILKVVIIISILYGILFLYYLIKKILKLTLEHFEEQGLLNTAKLFIMNILFIFKNNKLKLIKEFIASLIPIIIIISSAILLNHLFLNHLWHDINPIPKIVIYRVISISLLVQILMHFIKPHKLFIRKPKTNLYVPKRNDFSLNSSKSFEAIYMAIIAIPVTLLIFSVIITLYSGYIYPYIPQSAGGGKAIKCDVVVNEDLVIKDFSKTENTYLLDQSTNFVIILATEKEKENDYKIYQIPQNNIQAIITYPKRQR